MTTDRRKGDYFGVYSNKGFHLSYNGITISVQFGPGNYCEHYDYREWERPIKEGRWESLDAEVAIWKTGGSWITDQVFNKVLKQKLDDIVASHVSPKNVARLISWMYRRTAR